MVKYIHAEMIKLKYPPILWLISAIVFVVAVLIYFAHSNDVESISAIGKNPWNKIWTASSGIYSIFLNGPFLILFLSACFFIEHQGNALKYQYTVPISRAYQLIIKLLTILIMLVVLLAILMAVVFAATIALGIRYPEMEFSHYSINASLFIDSTVSTLINSLGIIGIQFYLSLRFKGFLLPASIGILAFILGLIIGVINVPVSHYWPYSYPLIGQDFQMFTIDQIGIVDFGFMNSVQLCSLTVFILFTAIAINLERRRNV